MAFTPHTPDDIKTMLDAIGVMTIDQLFDEIPNDLRCKELSTVPDAQNEMLLLQTAKKQAAKNKSLTCFMGAGSYEHHIPAAVWDLCSRGEFLTAYTPYQAEASQGGLQLLYEFQTMIAELTGMEVANASLYDGATALAEAILMSVRVNKRSKSAKVLLPLNIHPLYRETVQSIVKNQNIELIPLSYDLASGTTKLDDLQQYSNEDITAIVIAQPSFFGTIEDVDAMTDWANKNSVLSIACVNPIAMNLLEAPGNWGTSQQGVDIACGEGQPMGIPMAGGGPYFGFLSAKKAHVRQMPGRLVGRTVDTDGKTGYALTLQAREQHIRRGKATSNICTNQGLLVTAATIHMSLMGAEGLEQVARLCHHNTCILAEKLAHIEGVRLKFNAPFFHEIVLEFDELPIRILKALESKGIAGGVALAPWYTELANCILICATEMRTEKDITTYADCLTEILHEVMA